MAFLPDLVYTLALPVAGPLLALKSRRTGKYRTDWPARFGLGAEVFPRRSGGGATLLLHCVSVGELLSVQTLIARLLAGDPELRIAVTTTTDTGTARARALYGGHPRVETLRFPFDFSFAVEALFDRVRPDAIALVELETWPNFLAIAQSRRVPVALINGRLSERSFPRYRLIRPVMGAMLRRLAFLGVQTEAIAGRFAALGAPAERMEVLPTLKYDNATFVPPPRLPGALARAMGLEGEHRLWVAGSTAPGEEGPLLEAYVALQRQHPGLRLAIAPRKPESLPSLLEALKSRQLRPILRTDRPDGGSFLEGENQKSENGFHSSAFRIPHSAFPANAVFILNTLGELKTLYALAAFVFVGRSLVPLGGSDMIEAAALAKPCCFGPHTGNFAEVVELLLAERAAIAVADGAGLMSTVGEWLADPSAAAAMGRHAREVIERQRGSTERYVEKLRELLKRRCGGGSHRA